MRRLVLVKIRHLSTSGNPGPPLQNQLWNVLVRAWFHPVLIAGDLKQAFLNKNPGDGSRRAQVPLVQKPADQDNQSASIYLCVVRVSSIAFLAWGGYSTTFG